MTDFFISYNRAEVAWAKWLDWQLRQAGHSTVVQVFDFRPGSNFALEMDRATRDAERTIAILSPDYLSALYTHPEWAAAFARDPKGEKRLLVPVRVRECELKGLLAQIVHVDLVGVDEADAAATLLAGLSPGARPTAEPAFPGRPASAAAEAAPRYPGTLPEIWNVPHLRNPHFTGRDDLLDRLHATLTSGRPAALTQTLRGLGGVGKTQTALEYAHRHAADYQRVWWVAAEEPATLGRDLADLAARLGLVERGERDQAAAAAAARRWLEGHGGWLLVFDNAEDPQALREVLPRGGAGHVIITSRRSDWGTVGTLAVEPFERRDSVRFLRERAAGGGEEAAAGAPAASELAEVLGDLPLALEQAAAYLEETGLAAGRYLDLFHERRRDLLARGVPEGHEAVATTWDLSFEQLETASPAAADLLRLLAFLAPDDLPREILAEHAAILPEPLAAAAADPIALGDAVAAARRLSLLEADTAALAMHRLVQAIARDRCAGEERRRWSEAAVALVDAAYRYDEYDLATWDLAGRLLPHAVAAVDRLDNADTSKPALRLLNDTGLYLLDRGALGDARRHLERSLAIAEELHGPDAAEVAIRANNIGQILKAQGDLEGALVHARRALEIGEAVYGKDHPKVAIRASNIGQILQAQGDLEGALAHARRALEIDEAVHGRDHPSVARDANNIGQILKDQGDLEGALVHVRRALEIDEAVYGKDHPEVATDANNIGQILKDQGDLEGALVHARRALEIDEAVHGRDHPSVARDANNIGQILQAQGDLEGALVHARRALEIDEAVYGKDHPNVAIDANNLGFILQAQGDLEGAREQVGRALAIRERVFGADHHLTIKSRRNLASLGE